MRFAPTATIARRTPALFREHIAKEENVLFALAVRLLGDARLAELDAAKPPASSAPTRS